MFHRLSGLLGGAAQRLEVAAGVRRGRLLLTWRDAVGPALAAQAAPTDIKGDTLFLLCTSPVWAQELSMRQTVILERLNRALGADPPLRRIRCKVGRPAPLPVEGEEAAPPVAWESVPIDAEGRDRVQRLAGEVRDPELARRVRRVLTQLEKRRTLEIASGLVPCPTCGGLCDRPPCRTCRRERRAGRRQRILQRLGREPWVTRADLLDEFPDLSAEDFADLRNLVRSRLRRDVWSGLRALEEGSPLPDRLRTLILELTMLGTSLPAHRLQPKHLKGALPKTIARAYLENKAPGPWAPPGDTKA